jgi:hypothetical protein
MHGSASGDPVTQEVFTDPIVQLAAICPICALAALSPTAALAALSPILDLFNPAINPAAALLAFQSPQQRITTSAHGRVQQRLASVKLEAILRRAHR